MITLNQLKTYTAGVLKGWFTNKDVLDKLSESEDGNLLYNGNEIVGSSEPSEPTEVIQKVVGRKMYKLYDGNEAIGNITYAEGTILSESIKEINDSIENYDSILVTFNLNNMLLMQTNEIPVEILKLYYNKGCANIYINSSSVVQIGFTDATHIGFTTNTCNNLSNMNVYGIKYETVSADPITDTQVTQAVTETVSGLNAAE